MSEQNEILNFPVYSEILPQIKEQFVTNFKQGMLLVDTSSLNNIEYTYGRTIYENVFVSLKQTINKLKETKLIHQEDIICLNQYEGAVFYIFFSKEDDEKKYIIKDYESIAKRVQVFINNNMFATIFPLLKEKPRVSIGFAITFNNPTIKEERLLQAMIKEALIIAKYQARKNAMLSKEKVYELIINKKLKTVYQPIVNIKTHQVLGYEALSRGPEAAEYENPYVLFSIAKEIGLLYELDWLCKINIFQDAKRLESNLKLFVNIFSSSIHDSQMRVKYLEDLLSDANIKPNDVVFEISERYAIEDADFFNEITKLYSHTSFAIAIDDTWIGSNIALLKNLKLHYIKLNMSLIRDIDKHNLSRDLVASLQEIAHKVGAEIIAEGIQTKKELRSLVDLGITFGQGYLFARPGPAFPEVNITEIYMEDEVLKNRLLASVFYKRGMDYFKKGQFDQSILEFSKVLEIDTKNTDALYYKAHAFHEDGCYRAALKDIAELLNIKPDYTNAYLTKALSLEELKRYDDAIDSYMHYIKNAPAIYQSNIDLSKKRVEELLKKKAEVK